MKTINAVPRRRLDRSVFIREGQRRNAAERAMDGVTEADQVDPAHAWKTLYGNRQFVWLDLLGRNLTDQTMAMVGTKH